MEGDMISTGSNRRTAITTLDLIRKWFIFSRGLCPIENQEAVIPFTFMEILFTPPHLIEGRIP
jgi:hypothetical protein